VLDAPFLDVSSLVSRGNEQGLLGLAFHPGYAKNGRFFIYYTNTDGDTRVVEYHVSSADPDVADPKPVRTLLEVKQPYSNHNGGNIVFGPDGLLWIGLGDGGAANDPHGNGQSDASLLAKMLRIDVDASPPKPITQFKGLRNPWRWAFDAKTGDLYIGDVGQNKYEEVDAVPAATAAKGGLNFGWNRMEGLHCFADDACASNQADLTLPVVEYDHASGTGCSVTGGVVYRGKALPELDGMYFYSDYCTCFLRSFRYDAATNRISAHYDWQKLGKKLTAISSFGTDAAGELYVVSLDGIVWRLDRKP
jgi:glucose/arabinose dehydrogenase